MNRRWKLIFLILLLSGSTSCDLYTKGMAKKYLKYALPVEIVSNMIELRYTENDAIAFSMLKSIALPLRNVIIYVTSFIAFILLGIITYQSRRESLWWLGSLMLILSGALGNLFDRILNGYVVDFIHLHYGDQFSWPIFNVADILITIGAIVLGILMMRKSAFDKRNQMEMSNP